MSNLLDGRYKCLYPIGEGVNGADGLAYDTLNDTDVAIKFFKESLPESVVKKAREEFETGKNLSHPNLLQSYDFNCVDGVLYIVMPYWANGSLENRCGKISEKEIWKMVKDVASGLEYLHSNGMVHLDVKPSNILLDSQGNYLVSDFGLSHKVETLIHSYDATVTAGGQAYKSPEICLSGGKIDTSSDIWSLGVSIYELLTGELPFNGFGGSQQIAGHVLHLQCDKCSPQLSNLIDACISPDSANRPSATDVVTLADAVLKGATCEFPEFDIKLDGSIFKEESPFYNTYCDSVLDAMKRYRVTQSPETSLYGIIDDKGEIVVDFLYDQINHIGEFCWPGPGPMPPHERFFIGAFFRQGEDAGYFSIKDDGSISENGRCTYECFMELVRMT